MEKSFTQSKIQQVVRNGYGLSLEGVLSNAFELHKRLIFPGLLVTLVYAVVMVMVVGLMFENIYGMSMSEFMNAVQTNPQKITVAAAGIPLASKITSALVSGIAGAFIAPMLYGLYKIAFSTEFEVHAPTSDLFAYYKQPYFLNIFIYTLLFSMVLQALNLGMDSASFPGGWLISLVIQIILSVTFILVVPFIVFGNLNWMEAIKASARVTSKNWFFLLFILIITFIIVIIGFFFCLVGGLFTYPFMYFIAYVLYKEIIGFSSTGDEISRIGEE